MIEFKPFPKIARLSRECVITEKLDGTNAQIYIGEDGTFLTGSRNRWITPESDNYGFSRWAHERKEELLKLGPGQHFGEWWGAGIQRRYDLCEKHFSLFNVGRWARHDAPLKEGQEYPPLCCDVVPVLYEGVFETAQIEFTLSKLMLLGSVAAPGFMRPEGIIVFHKAAGVLFKKLLENDSLPKSLAEAA
jgi:hypothetical protein